MTRVLVLVLALSLAACTKSAGDGNSEAAIANQAAALEESANAAVADPIAEFDAQTNAAFAASEEANAADAIENKVSAP